MCLLYLPEEVAKDAVRLNARTQATEVECMAHSITDRRSPPEGVCFLKSSKKIIGNR